MENTIADQFLEEHTILLEGFYSFYEDPEDSTKYFKVPTPGLLIDPHDEGVIGFISYDIISDFLDEVFGDGEWLYLGSARLTDGIRLLRMLGSREEVDILGGSGIMDS